MSPGSLCLAILLLCTTVVCAAPTTLSENGRSDYVVVVSPQAIAAERHAAEELALWLGKVTGAEFPVQESSSVAPERALVVGPDLAAVAAPDLDLAGLSPDGIVVQTRGERIIFAGDRPRGTLYAVYRFLEDTVGIRWWTPSATHVPSTPTLTVPEQHVRYVPPLEYRETFWYDAFVDKDWAVRNCNNGMRTQLDEQRGGCVRYVGNFVHTFAQLVNPKEHFAAHPEWFAFVNGERRTDPEPQRTGLCLTNSELKDFLVERVFEWIQQHPEGTIISVSQNDSSVHCQCDQCRALEEAEGSPAGPLLAAVNYVAERVAQRYPHIAVDTLAYQYTRRAPRTIRPLPNVIVRLCSIECSFLQPLSAPENEDFGNDLRDWSKICNRLYVWDYTTNFSHYVLPHPNLRVLGPNVRFFVEHGVKGIFEQGAYHSFGAEFAPLRSWVLAKLLWNPYQDDEALIEQFVQGYYGPAAGPILQYINLLHDTAEAWGGALRCFNPPTAGYLTLDLMAQAERLFNEAEAAVAGDAELLNRVQVARLPIRYVWAHRWHDLQAEARRRGLPWPGPEDYVANAQEFVRVAEANKVTYVGEGAGRKLETFVNRTIGLGRTLAPPPPGCEELDPARYLDLQDNAFRLAREGTWATLTHDDLASDKVAARMGGEHREWAVQLPLNLAGLDPQATYAVYASVRCQKKGDVGTAFTFGIYDVANKVGVASGKRECAEVPDDQYHTIEIGRARLHDQMYVWVAPPQNPDNVEAVWVDRIWLVQQEEQ